jgi:hypothetical protein
MANTTSSLSLHCQCGSIQAHVENTSVIRSNHLRCYCIDCQKFAQALDGSGSILDEYGGTQIVQVPIGNFKILSGLEHVACLRLSESGLFRWYAKCCNTPIGNTLGAGWPFIGLIHNFIHDEQLEEKVGPVKGAVHLNGALGRVPASYLGTHAHKKLVLITLLNLLRWKLQGKAYPNCLFDHDKKPIVTPRIQAH